ncbi:unnamed protein product [Rhizoctonia solani]|uniref:RING-type domain-containing protein n=2 Tax=Rhizoctonia solani TaxID=456999 RepID=A0A8H3D689_9AGAM|nr:unnamed protein product [Rhizoctonia solani]CAE6522681.1 unnamed protein product [Rhizoctonia solani]
MDHDGRGNTNEHEQDQRDAMEVDGVLDMTPSDRFGREPPAFDENTERPRQRRRYHVTVQDDEIIDDEVAVLEAVPPRMSDLSIETPRSTTPPGEPVTMRDAEPGSPHINTIPLPDLPPPPPPLNPVMEAARRLTTVPDASNDQMQADLALLAPYIAAQAMAAAFPMRPPGTQGNGPPQPNAQDGQAPATNSNGMPPLPPFFFGLPPFMFGGNTEAPADPKRAERLANGLKVVEDGLLKRWKSVCGDQGAVCAVCYGELLEEPGIEKDDVKDQSEDKAPEAQELKPELAADEHERNLLEALKRREEMEKLEERERALKLETAVLAFPCGHVFHRTCLLPWLSRHTTCPTCRFDIDPKSDTLVLPAEDELPPFMGGPNGLNFGDYFTVGPVLRVPRSHIPTFGPRRGRSTGGEPNRGANPTTEEGNQPAGDGNQPTGEGNPPNGVPGEQTPTHGPSVAELFDMLLSSVLAAAGGPVRPPRQGQEGANPEGTNPEGAAPAPETVPARGPNPPEIPLPASPPIQSTAAPDPPVPIPALPQETPEASSSTATATSTSHPEIVARTLDYDRPMAMFGRPSPRRPPQSITPIWMRPPRPANAPALRTVPNDPATPTPRAVSSPVAPTTAPGPSTTPRSASTSRPTASPMAGLGQLRAMVSNLIPRRLSSSRAPSGTNASTESVVRGAASSSRGAASPSRGVASPTSARGVTSPIFSPREGGLRAMLHGPAALLRDLTASRRQNTDDMPELESDSESLSEDDADKSSDESEDDDLPSLEPIDPNTRGGRRPPQPEPEPEPQPAPAPAPRQDHMMDNIITLRIDLGHSDGRDETIIVPLLFNPGGRGDEQNQNQTRPGSNGQTRSASEPPPPASEPPRPASEPRRPRTPPPPKKWTPPEAIKTFRQVVEEKEREAGWRCDDPACLLGPADDEEPSDEHTIVPTYSIMRPIGPDEPVRYKIEDGIRVYADGEDVRVKGENPVCAHRLHPECLVTSARINGWGPDGHSKRVTLRCPMCRSEGTVERQVWDAGVQAE